MLEQNQVIQKILELTSHRYPDAEVYLYGSQARQAATSLSDWDLLILLNASHVSFALETKIMDEFYEIELETGQIVSPLIYPKQVWFSNYRQTPLFENIEKEGIRLR